MVLVNAGADPSELTPQGRLSDPTTIPQAQVKRTDFY
jgi:hypothetical protein